MKKHAEFDGRLGMHTKPPNTPEYKQDDGKIPFAYSKSGLGSIKPNIAALLENLKKETISNLRN